MRLRDGEVIISEIKRHKTPYILKIVKILIIALPVYVIFYYASKEITGEWIFYAYALVSFFVGIIISLFSVGYVFDKLIITNRRIALIDWQTIFRKLELTAEIRDIQDIKIKIRGILSNLIFFNYGNLTIETASSRISIRFHDCADPENVKNIIFKQMQEDTPIVEKKVGHKAISSDMD